MIDINLAISIIAIIFTVPTGLPILTGIILHYFYQPDIEIQVQDKSDEVESVRIDQVSEETEEIEPRIVISNNSPYDLHFQCVMKILDSTGGRHKYRYDTYFGDIETGHTDMLKPMVESEIIEIAGDHGFGYRFPIYPTELNEETEKTTTHISPATISKAVESHDGGHRVTDRDEIKRRFRGVVYKHPDAVPERWSGPNRDGRCRSEPRN
jgi:hypothetical protein